MLGRGPSRGGGRRGRGSGRSHSELSSQPLHLLTSDPACRRDLCDLAPEDEDEGGVVDPEEEDREGREAAIGSAIVRDPRRVPAEEVLHPLAEACGEESGGEGRRPEGLTDVEGAVG